MRVQDWCPNRVRPLPNAFSSMSMRRLLLVVPALLLAACGRKPDTTPESQASAPAPATPATPAADPLVRADKARIMGSETAKVWMIVASDFQCPFCRAFHHETWKRIEKDYVATGKIRVAFLNHPMEFHRLAIPAAEAAMCAGRQDKFWVMHDSLFTSQDRWVKSPNPQSVFESLAGSVGVDMNEWRTCVTSRAMRPMVEADFARSQSAGVKGTPSFIIGDVLAVVGAAPYEDFRSAIDAALARADR